MTAPLPLSEAARVTARPLLVHRSTGDILADRRYAYAAGYLEDGDLAAAADLAAQALERAPGFAPAWALLGEALAAQGDVEGAIAALERARTLEPEDALGVGVTLARLGALPAADAIAEGYVRALFDSYAERFDEHLTGDLGYRGPQLLRDALDRHAPGRRFAHALDLGCGTGLMGEAIRDRVARLAGCDLAPAMVEKAREKGVYDALDVAELTAWLDGMAPASIDLMLAADVLVYVGDPVHVLAAAGAALAEGGLFAFSVQALDEEIAGEGYAIGADARFSHSARFLRARAAGAGLRVVAIEPATTRCDAGVPVPGHLVVLAR
ncbi:class I SAM-dependent DNA methyltransferase [Salinarimonas ramus]|uniref:Methyltransferase n=1 Tax=Salinarimonas ramus TaxID=690164 RepID=A0A917V470_9HYPH|nr:methyltransferase domain-containing protein [Salinarimonas ramus]GGK34883.1 methyltransferase [Salinarimonas ramus]